MKRRYIQALLPILVPVTVIFTTASSSAGQQTGTPTTILCGAIDMSRVPVELEWVDLLRIDVEPAEVVTLQAGEGLYWGTDIAPGRYRFLRFGGSDGTGAPDLVYLFPPEGVSWAEFDPERPDFSTADLGQREIVVTDPGLYYLGTRRVSPEGPTRYHTVTVGVPGEKETLERLLTFIEDPAHRTIIQRRLNEIGKN